MNYINFDKTQLVNLEYSIDKEILRTNRAGSYSLSTIVGCNTRKYHGLLICPVKQLGDERHVLLSSLDESLIHEGNEFRLGIHKFPGDYYDPKGHKYIKDFYIDSAVVTVYQVGNVIIKKETIMVDLEEQFLIRYTIEDCSKPVKIKFQPFLAFRNIHTLSKANLYVNTKVNKIKNGIETRMYENYPSLHLQFSKDAEFLQVPDWFYNIEYLKEKKRGYEYQEDLFVPGYFEINLKKGESVIFSASTKETDTAKLKDKFTTITQKRVARDNFKDCLVNAAQQFYVRTENNTDIIAGYPWFNSCSRDTFISLPGLSLAIDDEKSCKDVIDSYIKRHKEQFSTNTNGENFNSCNTIDAPLWFFWSLQQYAENIQDKKLLWKTYGSIMKSILQEYKTGRSANIKMHNNYLIYGGEPDKALTWMSAIHNGVPITPRIGYDVEVNALWYNAVKFSLELSMAAGDKEFFKEWSDMPEHIEESFLETFWDEKRGYLADYVNDNYKDWSVRPNMVIAIAMKFTPLKQEQRKSIIDVATKELLTPRGLRTLSPKNPMYKSMFKGTPEQRDMAYHQGTAWPWLLEFYAKAYLDIFKKSGVSHIQKIVDDFEPEMHNKGIGTISEIYDGDPPHIARGTISQAWSVAALLRIIKMLEQQAS